MQRYQYFFIIAGGDRLFIVSIKRLLVYNSACYVFHEVECSSSDFVNYVAPPHTQPRKYTVISSPDQRQRYKNDFNAEYNEYRDLHAGIESITRQFTVLDNELKQLQQGTDKYKVDSAMDPKMCCYCWKTH